ncbi:phage distal tail protein [Streptomyces sp. NPDC096339]|uniref:phage distal tail protein n=1 Tax=Streptomyces sp. NPDC096339 TaxID=3366086 RepID=UPI00380B0AB8
MAVAITLGTLQLSNTDSAGVQWTVTNLKGWHSAGVRAGYQPRQSDHGGWASPVYLDSRPITVEGLLSAPSTSARDAAIEQLIAADSLTDTTLSVAEAIPKQATVRRSGELLIELVNEYSATYSALVTAADPRRYSTTLQSQSTGLPSVTGGLTLPITMPITISTTSTGGGFTLTNAGTIATRPTFTLTGPAALPVITATRPDGSISQLAYSESLGAGDTLVIDTAAHSVILNGTVSRRPFISAQPYWPEIAPGSSLSVRWTASAYDPAALLTGTCRSAWM